MFCIKCGAEIPEGAKFCIRCGTPAAGNVVVNNSVTENPAVGNAAVNNSVTENPAAGNVVVNNSVTENPAAGNAAVNNSVTEDPTAGNAAVGSSIAGNAAANIAMAGSALQEKLEAVKPVISEMGKKLGETAGPAIGEMGKKLGAAASPAVGAIESKLNGKLGKKKLGIIGAGAVVVLVLILLLRGGGKGPGAGFSSPEKAYDAWMTGFCLHDFDLTLQAEPDFVIKYEGGADSLRMTLQRNYNNDIATKSNAGFFKFEAVGHTKVEKDELKKFEQEMRNFYGVNVKFSEAAIIEHRLVDLTDDSDGGSTGISAYAFKYKGKWYYMNTGRL